MKHNLIYLVTHVQDVTGYNEYEVWTDRKKAHARVKEMISNFKAEDYNPEEIYDDEDFYLDVWKDDGRHTISINEIYSNQPYTNNLCPMRFYARKCDITGEGMNEGFFLPDIGMYIKKESDLIKYLRENGDSKYNNASDDFILNESYEHGYHVWTEWYEDEDISYLHDYFRGSIFYLKPAKVVDYRGLDKNVIESLKKGCWFVQKKIVKGKGQYQVNGEVCYEENETLFWELVTKDLEYIRIFPERIILEGQSTEAI